MSAEVCPDCGRPHARDGCETCGRSRAAPWPVTALVLGEGKGAPGRKRVASKHGVRRFQVSVKLTEAEAAKIKRIATERGHTLGQVIRDLIEDGHRHRAGGITDAKRAQLKALSRPGNYRPNGDRPLRPVVGSDLGGDAYADLLAD